MFLRIAALALISASLAGCIVVPGGRYRDRGHGYVAAPAVVVEGRYRYNDDRRGDYRDNRDNRDWRDGRGDRDGRRDGDGRGR